MLNKTQLLDKSVTNLISYAIRARDPQMKWWGLGGYKENMKAAWTKYEELYNSILPNLPPSEKAVLRHFIDQIASFSPYLYYRIPDNMQETIDQFRSLLDTRPDEETLHKFLKAQPDLLFRVFNCCGPVVFLSKPHLGADYIPDFVIGYRATGGFHWQFIEIESPNFQLFTKKNVQSSKLSAALRQLLEWKGWLRENIAYAHQFFPDMIEPALKLVIGRRHDLTAKQASLLKVMNSEQHRLEIVTYDRLLS